ncbi:hypothetical protein JMJ35_002464 [Cladonia borealis]|uniref:Cyanide hydratase n=1 Tax=Cladonia borealis TaxID=184061 RepID=A0AA39V9C4_9LECA|nr:hypothetical protein JMJ35_002464 [Cladonia borealis]
MPAQIKKYKAAAVTAEPGWFDLELSVQKTIKWINEAGAAGCRLVAFPEVWIPGYPYWMWKINYQQSLPFLKAYRENSLPSDSDEMRRIRAAARENGIYVSLGYSEIDMATCHLAQVLIGPNGDILNHRRKIKPTHVEKLVFGDGAGDTFEPVVDTDIGRVGQLNCWENMNPFLKAYACSLGEQVHIAAWPIYPDKTTLSYPDPFTNVSDPNSDIVSPAYAIETCTYVLAPFQRLSQEGVAKNTPPGVDVETPERYNGHTRIYGPDGSLLAKPGKDFEGLVFVDIDLNESHLPKALADFGGHYMRADLIRLLVDTRRKELITHADTDGGIGSYSTLDRVSLSKPLSEPKPDVRAIKKMVPKTRTEPEGNGVLGNEGHSAY